MSIQPPRSRSRLLIVSPALFLITLSVLACPAIAQTETVEQYRARAARVQADLKARLGTPAADEIYSVNESRMAQRPRLYFHGRSLAEIKQRFNDPAFASEKLQSDWTLKKWTDRAITETKGADIRDYGDVLPALALRVLIEEEPAKKAQNLETVLKWTRVIGAWGTKGHDDLQVSQEIIGLATVYDWLHDILSPEDKAAIRATLITHAQSMDDESNSGLTMWRWQRWVFNHNWIDYAARAYAAMALWGDDAAPLEKGQVKKWLDWAMVNYWIVDKSHAADGIGQEGATYQDYGLRMYIGTISNAEYLLNLREPFFNEHLRTLVSRLHKTLPGTAGLLVYGDSHAAIWTTNSPWWNLMASRFNDDRFTFIAQHCENVGIANQKSGPPGGPRAGLSSWQAFFYKDPARVSVDPSTLPTHFDGTDFGLYTARSDWSDKASYFGLRCGWLDGKSVARKFGGDRGNGHLYPNQGAFSFYVGETPIIPGRPYPHEKLTMDHPVTVFEGRDADAGKLTSQAGGGEKWFYVRPAKPMLRNADILKVEHAADYHHFLCDLGGVYWLADSRAEKGAIYPTYFRSLVYLPSGALVIVDKIATQYPRSPHFRLPSALETLQLSGRDFIGTAGGKSVTIRDLSPTDWKRAVKPEVQLDSFDGKHPRQTIEIYGEDVTSAVFAVIIDVDGSAAKCAIQTDEAGYTLTGLPTGNLRVDWPVTR